MLLACIPLHIGDLSLTTLEAAKVGEVTYDRGTTVHWVWGPWNYPIGTPKLCMRMNAVMTLAIWNLLSGSERKAGSGSSGNPSAVHVESSLQKLVRAEEIFKSSDIPVMGSSPGLVGVDSPRIPQFFKVML